jgi:hypothetical protein
MATGFINNIKLTLRDAKRQRIIKKWRAAGCPVPTPPALKHEVIEHYQAVSGYTTLIETGTFRGDMVEAQRENFKRIYSIELSHKLWETAARRFKSYDHITIVEGDSGKMLGGIISQLTSPAIFWLDGHYSAGETAKGDTECPIFEEISAILVNDKFNHILLVDDARLFNGQGDYPATETLTQFIKSRNPLYQLEVADDIIRYTIQ